MIQILGQGGRQVRRIHALARNLRHALLGQLDLRVRVVQTYGLFLGCCALSFYRCEHGVGIVAVGEHGMIDWAVAGAMPRVGFLSCPSIYLKQRGENESAGPRVVPEVQVGQRTALRTKSTTQGASERRTKLSVNSAESRAMAGGGGMVVCPVRAWWWGVAFKRMRI